MKTNILVLAAGEVGFDAHDADYPLCLTEMDGISLLERIVDNTRNIQDAHYAFALLDTDIERFHLDKVVSLLASTASIIRIPKSTKGSACTSLLAASQLDPDGGLLIISANEFVHMDFAKIVEDFKQRNLDGGTLVFRSVHPRYSYVRLNEERLVTEAAQQNPISHHATAGVFWFARVGDFVEGAKNLIRKDASVSGKFFVAPTFNEMILKHAKIGVTEMDIKKYQPLKSERQVQLFEHGGGQL